MSGARVQRRPEGGSQIPEQSALAGRFGSHSLEKLCP